MKKNNQGFMLVEALVMSTVIIGVLVFMFIQFRNISRGYDRSFSYDTVSGLYHTNELKRFLIYWGILDYFDDFGAEYELDYYLEQNKYMYIGKYSEEENAYKYFVVYDEENNEYDELLGSDGWDDLKYLLKYSNIKNAIVTNEPLNSLKGSYDPLLSEGFNDYINYVKVNGEADEYRLVVEFFDGTYASLNIGGVEE